MYNVVPQTNASFTASGKTVLVNFNYTYDQGGGTCSGITCHQARGINTTFTWGRSLFGLTGVNVVYTANNCEVTFTPYVNSQGTAPYAYSWNFGDGTTSTQQNPTHIFPTGISYATVTLNVRDANRHPASTTMYVSFTLQQCH